MKNNDSYIIQFEKSSAESYILPTKKHYKNMLGQCEGALEVT